MKLFKIFFLAAFVTSMLTSCDEEIEPTHSDPIYHIHIHKPDNSDKTVGDVMDIKVDFSEHAEGTVHHVKVRIYNKADNTEIFNAPSEAHVHEIDGMYTFEDQITLDVVPNTDWVLEAKVWGHEAGISEEIETVEFKVVE